MFKAATWFWIVLVFLALTFVYGMKTDGNQELGYIALVMFVGMAFFYTGYHYAINRMYEFLHGKGMPKGEHQRISKEIFLTDTYRPRQN